MAKSRLKYVNTFRSKGKVYHYFRHGGVIERLPGEPDSAPYLARYAELVAGVERQSPQNPHAYNSVDWLLADYKASPKFQRLAPKTQLAYAHMIEQFRRVGAASVSGIRRKHIQELRKPLLDRPRTADEFAKVASVVFAHAVDLGLIDVNPAAGIAKVNRSEPYRAWTDAEVEAFEKACRPGPLLTAFMLGLYTGQRRGDILRMGWAAYDNGFIAVRQSKTGVTVRIPAHSKLRQHLEAVRRKTLLVPGPSGGVWDLSGFSKAFRAGLDAVGLPADVHFHGLRKTATKRLADAGCDTMLIRSITGHKTDAMVAYYAADANRAKQAVMAMDRLETSEQNSNKQ